MTVRELIDALEADIRQQAELHGGTVEQGEELPVYAGNTVGDGISWFTVTGLFDVHTPDGGIIVELAPSGSTVEVGDASDPRGGNELHRRIVDEALTNGTVDCDPEPRFTFGELVLFHTLLQDHGLELVGDDRFIPLLERNMKRIEKGPLT